MKSTFYAVEAFIGVVAFLVMLLLPSISTEYEAWVTENIKWAWSLLGIVFAHLFLKAIYDQHAFLEDSFDKKVAKLTTENTALKRDVEAIRRDLESPKESPLRVSCDQTEETAL